MKKLYIKLAILLLRAILPVIRLAVSKTPNKYDDEVLKAVELLIGAYEAGQFSEIFVRAQE